MKIYDKLEDLGYLPIAKNYDEYLTEWLQYFKGDIKDFHEYTTYNGNKKVSRKRLSLGMAKKVCEDWADSLFNPETNIIMGDHRNQEWLDNVLGRNNFRARFNELLELSMGLGNGATVVMRNCNGEAEIQFLDAQMIIPLGTYNGEVSDVAFVSLYTDDVVYVNIHEKLDNGYLVKNLFFGVDNNKELIELTEGQLEVIGVSDVAYEEYSEVKLFQLYKPAIANNIDVGSPYGISVFHNAQAELKSCDIGYTALNSEVDLGKIRVYVQASALNFGANEDGEVINKPVFNSDQEEFYLLPEDITNDDGTLINVQAPALRVEDFEKALEKNLTMLGRKVGFGDDAYSFKDGAIYTNTAQVISTNSKFYKTRMKFATLIENGIEEMVKALYFIEYGRELKDTVSVDFDDSIIQDKDAMKREALIEYKEGLISKITYYMRTEGMTREEAIDYNNTQIEDMSLDEDVESEDTE